MLMKNFLGNIFLIHFIEIEMGSAQSHSLILWPIISYIYNVLFIKYDLNALKVKHSQKLLSV